MAMPQDPAAMAAMAARLIVAGAEEQKVNALISETFKYVTVAAMAMAIADSIHCLLDEIQYVWFSDWSLIKILYLLSRYLMLAAIPVELILNTRASHTAFDCQRFAYTGSLMALLGVIVAEGILYVRAYALAGRSKYMGAFLIATFIALNTAALAFHVKYITGITFAQSPLPKLLPCFASVRGNRQYVTNVFIFVLASEITVLAITSWACFRTYRLSKSPLIVVCSRDGLFYFALIALASTANIVVNLAAPQRNMFAVTQRMLHGVLSTRMILRIRKAADHRGPQVFGSDATSMVPMSDMSTTYPSGMIYAEGKGDRKFSSTIGSA